MRRIALVVRPGQVTLSHMIHLRVRWGWGIDLEIPQKFKGTDDGGGHSQFQSRV